MSKSPKDTHGPIVKTGPTRGQNRSRTKEGTWRRKRSDAGVTRDVDDKGSDDASLVMALLKGIGALFRRG